MNSKASFSLTCFFKNFHSSIDIATKFFSANLLTVIHHKCHFYENLHIQKIFFSKPRYFECLPLTLIYVGFLGWARRVY